MKGILLFGIKYKMYHCLFIFFILKGKVSFILGKNAKRVKKVLGIKVPLDY